MIADLLIVALSTTAFVDTEGRIHLFYGGLSLDESQRRGLAPLIVFGMSRRTTTLCLFQYQLLNRARIDTFLASAWAMGCLGGAPNLLIVQHGLDASLGKQLRRTIRAQCPTTEVSVLDSSFFPLEFERSAALHVIHLVEGCVDDSMSCEEIVEVGNRREKLDAEMKRQSASVTPGARINTSEMKPLFVELEPFLGVVLKSVKGLPDGTRWAEFPQATNLVAYSHVMTITDQQMRWIEQNSLQREEEERYAGSLSKLRDALRCLPFARSEAFEESLPEFGAVEFLEGDDDISGDLAQSIHERIQENNVFFPDNPEQFMAALLIVTDETEDLVAIAELTARAVVPGQYRFLITAQRDGTTTLYCLPRASILITSAWLEQFSCFAGTCEILSEAMIALKSLVNLPMTAALSRQIPELIDCFLEEDPEWPNYPGNLST